MFQGFTVDVIDIFQIAADVISNGEDFAVLTIWSSSSLRKKPFIPMPHIARPPTWGFTSRSESGGDDGGIAGRAISK
jgi:hypothetical protein